jgi:HlyD family type I secretion membrane fusion protein
MPGTVIAETKSKPIAHLRGGVVEKIHVVEGQDIEAGELLISLGTRALEEQMVSLGSQLGAAEKQIELAREEIDTVQKSEERPQAVKLKTLALQRMVAEAEKDAAAYRARLAALKEERQNAGIRAPVSGRVLSLGVHAAGAIVQPGVELAEIVPRSDKLVIEGRLHPMQIENVLPGMDAKVWLSAPGWREQRPLAARLAWISADSVEDKRTGAPYFLVRIELSVPTGAQPPMKLQPGMGADVLLLTGQRTLLDQLIDPLMRNVHKVFHG